MIVMGAVYKRKGDRKRFYQARYPAPTDNTWTVCYQQTQEVGGYIKTVAVPNSELRTIPSAQRRGRR